MQKYALLSLAYSFYTAALQLGVIILSTSQWWLWTQKRCVYVHNSARILTIETNTYWLCFKCTELKHTSLSIIVFHFFCISFSFCMLCNILQVVWEVLKNFLVGVVFSKSYPDFLHGIVELSYCIGTDTYFWLHDQLKESQFLALSLEKEYHPVRNP